MESKKKRMLIILIIVLLLLITSCLLYWFLLKDKFNSVDNTQSNKVQNDDNVKPEFEIPDYLAADFKDIAPEIVNDLKGWNSDYRVFSITGTTAYTLNGEERIYYGTDGGKFSSWMLNVYSPSKKLQNMYLWSDGEGEFSEDMDIDTPYIADIYNKQAYFNDLLSLASTDLVVSSAISNGLDLENNYIYLYLGESNLMEYGDKYQWKVVERSKTENDEYSIGKFIKAYTVDAKNGEFVGYSDKD